MASKSQEYTISHTGGVLGAKMVDTQQNQVAPQRPTMVASFECPKKFDSIEYVGRRDATRFVPRTSQSATITDADNSGALEEGERTVALNADIQPIAGDETVADQDYPVVVVVNTTAGAEVGPDEFSVNYATNEVTVADSAVTAGDSVKFFPVITEGKVQLRGLNQFEQVEGHVNNWATPIYRWHDFEQLKEGREINLDGAIEWGRYEKLEILVDSPRTVIWQDADFPEEYVTTLQQDVVIHLES